jgi:hypothetical protein
MTREEYEKLRSKAEQQLRLAQEEFRQNVEAIERVWRMTQDDGGGNHHGAEEADDSVVEGQNESEQEGRGAFSRGELLTLIRKAISQWPHKTFNVVEIRIMLTQSYPHRSFRQESLAAALRRLEELGEIRVDAQGAGRRATRYTPAKSEN